MAPWYTRCPIATSGFFLCLCTAPDTYCQSMCFLNLQCHQGSQTIHRCTELHHYTPFLRGLCTVPRSPSEYHHPTSALATVSFWRQDKRHKLVLRQTQVGPCVVLQESEPISVPFNISSSHPLFDVIGQQCVTHSVPVVSHHYTLENSYRL